MASDLAVEPINIIDTKLLQTFFFCFLSLDWNRNITHFCCPLNYKSFFLSHLLLLNFSQCYLIRPLYNVNHIKPLSKALLEDKMWYIRISTLMNWQFKWCPTVQATAAYCVHWLSFQSFTIILSYCHPYIGSGTGCKLPNGFAYWIYSKRHLN